MIFNLRAMACTRARRGTVLFAVLFLVVIAALSASTMLTSTAAERSAAARSLDELELRAAIRSALAVITADLASERDEMMRGESPATPEPLRIDRNEGELDIAVELIAPRGGALLIPEAGRLSINHAKIESLMGLSGIDEAIGQAIIRRRSTTPFGSTAEVLALTPNESDFDATGFEADSDSAFDNDEIDPSLPIDARPLFDDEVLAEIDAFGSSNEKSDRNAWINECTVFSAEPQLMAGLAGADFVGSPRINVNAPWSDRLERSLAEVAGEGMAETLRTLFINAPRLTKPSEIVKLLTENSVPVDQWGVLLDIMTTTADPYRLGLVDLNSASEATLATLPAISSEAAQAIADARDRLDGSERLSVTWPLDDGILTPEEFRACVDVLTTRCFQWRFTIRAAFEPDDDEVLGFDPDDASFDLLPEADEFGVAIEEQDEDVGPSLVFDVVLDLAAPEVRIAYLRERTAYDFAVAVAALPGFVGDSESGDSDRPDRQFERVEPADGVDRAGVGLAGESDELEGDEPFDGRAGGLGSSIETAGLNDRDDTSNSSGGRGNNAGNAAAGVDKRLGRWAPRRTGSGGR